MKTRRAPPSCTGAICLNSSTLNSPSPSEASASSAPAIGATFVYLYGSLPRRAVGSPTARNRSQAAARISRSHSGCSAPSSESKSEVYCSYRVSVCVIKACKFPTADALRMVRNFKSQKSYTIQSDSQPTLKPESRRRFQEPNKASVSALPPVGQAACSYRQTAGSSGPARLQCDQACYIPLQHQLAVVFRLPSALIVPTSRMSTVCRLSRQALPPSATRTPSPQAQAQARGHPTSRYYRQPAHAHSPA